jgi:GMP synthase-like glutamine amidotransferase
VVQHEDGTGPGWWQDWLEQAGLDLDLCRPDRGDPLPATDGYAGLLVLGGAMGPLDDGDCPWLPATRDLLAGAVRDGLPAFGICLGAELMVAACGGGVRRGTAGPEIGVLEVRRLPAAADDPVFAGLPDEAPVLQWHIEEMTPLPADAVLLATSAPYPNQAFRLGPCAWGVQGHPEVTADIVAGWARAESPLLRATGLEPRDLVQQVSSGSAALERTWRPVAEGFAAVVRG